MILSQFHFLRPEWLLVLIPVAVVIAYLRRHKSQGGTAEWAGHVDAHLLQHLIVRDDQGGRSRGLITAFSAGLIAVVLAMAGPTWQKQPVPAFKAMTPSVIVLSLAQSMNSADLVPSRLARAGHKLRDMLDRAQGEDVALVIYADQPFVAAPLTSDGAVIRQMLPELSTSLMPVLGNRLDLAIGEAQGLLGRAGATSGRIVVLADDTGLDSAASLKAAHDARDAGFTVSVLGVGTAEGATLQTAQGRAIQTSDGQDVTVKVDETALANLAKAGGGTFVMITAGDADLEKVFADQSADISQGGTLSERTGDSWLDMGFYLLFIPLVLGSFAFRRGLMIAFGALMFGAGLTPAQAQAGTWQDLWKTPDQQAQAAFDAQAYDRAAALYSTPEQRGAALYRNSDFDQAAQAFGGSDYNKGNAQAKAGAFEEALASYDAWLATHPSDADAQFNRDLVAKLLEQQQQQDQQKQDEDQQQDGAQPPQDQQQAGESATQPQDSEQQAGVAGQQQEQAGDPQSGDPQSGEQQSGQDGTSQEQQAGGNPSDEPADESKPQADQQAQAGENPQQGEGQQNAAPKQTAEGSEGAQPAAHEEQATNAEVHTPDGANATDTQDTADAQEGSFSKMMDRLLGEPQDPIKPETAPSATASMPRLNQSAEQQLRRVPDDPSGLLRARIRQHYDRLRAAGPKG